MTALDQLLDAAARDLRDRLPLLADGVSFNHAGVAPQPRFEAVAAFEAARAERLPAEALASIAGVRARVTELYARMLKVTPAEIAITRNTAEGVNFVAQGFPWRAGDLIVTSGVEYPSNVYPWWNLKERGVEVRAVPERNGRIDLAELAAAIDGRTRLVALSHVEFASGFAFDLDQLADLCAERGAFLFLDLAQSIGALPVDLRRVDAAAWSAWKWLLGPLGMGGFYLAARHLERIQPVFVGSDSMVPGEDYLDYRFRFKPGAARFEYSTENALGLLGTAASLERFAPLVADAAAAAVKNRILAHGDRIAAIMEARGFRRYSSPRPGERSGILSFVAPEDPRRVAARLRERRVETAARAGRLRLAPHFYHTDEDFARLERALEG